MGGTGREKRRDMWYSHPTHLGPRQNYLWSRPSSPAPTAALLARFPWTRDAGDLSSIPGLGRFPGEGKGYHSSILAWRIPWAV